jgi:hypothetical protein
LWGEFSELGCVGMEEEAHVVVDKGKFCSDGDVILEFHIDCTLMLNETTKVGEKEVLSRNVITDISMDFAMLPSIYNSRINKAVLV